ncbi:MAG: redoxin domain-containing protein [Bacteroidales bacterium]|nr:redoxin domain-containing protein [Bacteroidales bacterium]
MRRLLSFAVLFACVLTVVAQKNITIRGTTVNAAGKTIELYNYSDKISQREVLLDRVTIGDDQTFQLRCFARYPMLVFVQIDNYSQSFYVEPGRDYNIYLNRFDWNQDEARNVYLDPVALPVEFIGLPKDDVNFLIDNLNTVVQRYVSNHMVYFDQRFRPQRRYFDSLLFEVEKQCPDGDNEFFNRYKRYYLAELKLNLKFASPKSIYDSYIRNQPVLCYDENYMSLFTALYSNAISKGTRNISVYRLAHWIYNLDYERFIDSLGTEPMLRHEQVRELAALLALKEAYHNFHYYDSKMVLKMIEMIGARTKFADHKPIARNLVESFQRTEAGSDVKLFLLPDVDKRLVSLDDFRGKWVYLSFVRVSDPNSQAEVATLAHFKDSIYAHNNNVEFVTIACDREFQKMYHFLKNSRKGERYNWTWLHFNGNYELLNNFRVCSYPIFVLINPEGKLQYDITPSPSTGFLLSPPWQRKDRPENTDGSFFLTH